MLTVGRCSLGGVVFEAVVADAVEAVVAACVVVCEPPQPPPRSPRARAAVAPVIAFSRGRRPICAVRLPKWFLRSSCRAPESRYTSRTGIPSDSRECLCQGNSAYGAPSRWIGGARVGSSRVHSRVGFRWEVSDRMSDAPRAENRRLLEILQAPVAREVTGEHLQPGSLTPISMQSIIWYDTDIQPVGDGT